MLQFESAEPVGFRLPRLKNFKGKYLFLPPLECCVFLEFFRNGKLFNSKVSLVSAMLKSWEEERNAWLFMAYWRYEV